MATVETTEQPVVVVADNELRLFVETTPFVESLTADIRVAQENVWVESYTIADDAAGQAVAAALKERAGAGVTCRLLYDVVGSFSTPERFFNELRESGVEVRPYRPFGNWLYRFRFLSRWHRRDHRKVTVIDGKLGYFGGMNLVDLGGSAVPPNTSGNHPEGSPPWRDVHVRMAGPKAEELAAMWDNLWARLHKRKQPKRRNPTPTEVLRGQEDGIFFFDSRPHVKHHRPGRMFRALMNHARKKITIAMAYFVPFGGILRALIRSRRRGVGVQVIVPHQSDVRLVQWASRHLYEKLLRHGIRIYERRDRMLHSKVMMIDDEWSIVGSCNLDPRSFLLNMEFFAIIRSAEFASALGSIVRYERSRSEPVHLGHIRKRSWWKRLLHRAAWTLRPWL